ncbi:MAG TPA: heparinase II/III family protein [Gemmatimonadaceae bacterium]|nr:heparinase II/III family protein [Gemmatimonadaceae bacterium]
MTLLLSDRQLQARRAAAAGPLAPLASSLAGELPALRERELYFPTQKALLSREGGRCPRDGAMLDFDPFSPHAHRCPVCGEVYVGDLHDRFWIYWYQLWLAERAVHAATFVALGDTGFAPLARAILDGYARRYDTYPNVDNVLGPTRLFFSTYLESIWLLQICIAIDLLDRFDPDLTARVRDQIIEPSRGIIASYDEGASNRQVWNDAALLAAARVLGDARAAESAVHGRSGVVAHLSEGLLPDGTWYEGENYHLFAHRGLWYGVTMAERAGLELPRALVERFQRGFAAPLLTALPDYTLPSRRDSQYAISLRQWRIAEHFELGLARADDPLLIGALARLYGDSVPRRDTGRRSSAADVERNAPASALSRADLSWRALLFALPVLPTLEPDSPASVLLDHQGIAVFRRDRGGGYVALDYGHSGGGHGHPDRLNLLLADGSTRWLDDYGTGSYVERSLHWYRSTLAHNAPLVDGRSQARVNGILLAHDERGACGWASALARGIAPDVDVERTIVVMPAYAIDIVRWRAERTVAVDLPLHVDAQVVSGAGALEDAALRGGSGAEDGFAFVHDTNVQRVHAADVVHARAAETDRQLDVWAVTSADCEWWRAAAPGAPGRGEHAFRLLRASAPSGEYRLVWSWRDEVAGVELGEPIRVHLRDGTVHEHRRDAAGWHVTLIAGTARSTIDLGGVCDTEPFGSEYENTDKPHRRVPLPVPTTVILGEPHYRRSEQTWTDAGMPTARVSLDWRADGLHVAIDVPRSDRTFAADAPVNRYDNEPPDINGDGVQLYVETAAGTSAWLLVPRADGGVRARPIEHWTTPAKIRAEWHPTATGYGMEIVLPFTGTERPVALDVIVNEMPAGRERRRGQLVLSGARGEFVYLRGDRHEPSRLLALQLPDA